MEKLFKFKNVEKYQGKYIAIVDGKVVASGKKLGIVIDKAKKEHPNKEHSIAHIPPKGVLAYGLFLSVRNNKR